MDITSMDQFAALPVGTKIADVSSGAERVWDKQQSGWVWEGTTLADRHFGPAIVAGQISTWLPPLPTVGQEYAVAEGGNTVYRVPMRVEGTRGNWAADVAKFNRRAVFMEFEYGVEFISGQPRTQGSNIPTATFASAQGIYAEAQKVKVLQAALHAYLDEHSYPEGSPLEQVMVAHGLEARYHDVTVTLTITGRSLRTIEQDELGEVTDLPEVFGDVKVEVPWRLTREVTVKAPGCGCRKVTNEMVRESIGFDHTHFEYTMSCPEHQPVDEAKPAEMADAF